jgi:hypothetical protein
MIYSYAMPVTPGGIIKVRPCDEFLFLTTSDDPDTFPHKYPLPTWCTMSHVSHQMRCETNYLRYATNVYEVNIGSFVGLAALLSSKVQRAITALRIFPGTYNKYLLTDAVFREKRLLGVLALFPSLNKVVLVDSMGLLLRSSEEQRTRLQEAILESFGKEVQVL